MAAEERKAFEGWCVLELMGHRRLAGYVAEEQIAGHGFIRLDIPEVAGDGEVLPAVTQFYSPASVYAITPTTEEMVWLVRSRPAPIEPWELPRRELQAVPTVVDHDDLDRTEDLDDVGELF